LKNINKNKKFMSTSPEKCLGNLIQDINEEVNPDEFYSTSKMASPPIPILDQKLSLDSIYSFKSGSTNASSGSILVTKKSILNAFNNQHDTILLQKMLMEASRDTLDLIIKEMSGTFSLIIKNKNGNYFCSDLFKVCDKNQRIIILKEIYNTLSEDCVDEYGTHPIQTLIELSECKEEYKLILSSFNDYNKILKAALNPNGSYVIQKIIVHIPERHRMEFNLLFLKFLNVLSMDMFGVCTVKKFIAYTKNELLVKQVLNIILNNFVNISENQYGNYLIQYILEHWWNTKEGLFLKQICISKFHILAGNHFSSYICDLFIKLSNHKEKKLLMNALIKDNTIVFLVNNNNGNIIMNKLMNSLRMEKGFNYNNHSMNFKNLKDSKK
jgi:hypothetical protein